MTPSVRVHKKGKESEYNHNCIRSLAQGRPLPEHLPPNNLLARRSSAVRDLSYNAPEITVHFKSMFYSFRRYTATLNLRECLENSSEMA
ncbi:hypothetical protein E2C01_036229 [Portunus trituberculatus]|uniref:Uncharacterized protein n=1 Tax=Portunus trituberculatus TaxID=210409 RepID=A0A5B7FBD4_PORTR|nr:hypothetical protein [Portunus trituberculatus]